MGLSLAAVVHSGANLWLVAWAPFIVIFWVAVLYFVLRWLRARS